MSVRVFNANCARRCALSDHPADEHWKLGILPKTDTPDGFRYSSYLERYDVQGTSNNDSCGILHYLKVISTSGLVSIFLDVQKNANADSRVPKSYFSIAVPLTIHDFTYVRDGAGLFYASNPIRSQKDTYLWGAATSET